MIGTNTKIDFREQERIIRHCIANEEPLSEALLRLGLGYDNLGYRHPAPAQVFSHYTGIDELQTPSIAIPAVSFFSGAGGLNIGFEKAGFHTLGSVEFESHFAATLRLNFPDHLVIGPPDHTGDIRQREEVATLLRKKIGINAPFEGVFHGGPPCQPFSIASNQRFGKEDINFKRLGFSDQEKGDLLSDYVWMIEQFRPKVFLIENVPGLHELDNGAGLGTAIAKLRQVGYEIASPRVINAAHYGIPQRRLRIFVVGYRVAQHFNYPAPTLQETPCLAALSRSLDGVENHLTREHNAASISRYMELRVGQRDQLGRVDRLNPNLPSKTIIAGGTKGGGRSHLHPHIPRTLSVRECARLQTFPEEFQFSGPVARQFTQVGNAVPPMLAYRFATEIREQLF